MRYGSKDGAEAYLPLFEHSAAAVVEASCVDIGALHPWNANAPLLLRMKMSAMVSGPAIRSVVTDRCNNADTCADGGVKTDELEHAKQHIAPFTLPIVISSPYRQIDKNPTHLPFTTSADERIADPPTLAVPE